MKPVASTTGKRGSQAASIVSGRLLANGLESGVSRIRPNGYLLRMSYFVWLPRLCFAAATALYVPFLLTVPGNSTSITKVRALQ